MYKRYVYKVFLVSAGRTGTRFLGKKLDAIIRDSFSCHEPDILSLNHIDEIPKKIVEFGFHRNILLKFIGLYGSKSISYRYLRDVIDIEKASELLKKQRDNFIIRMEKHLYIESNQAFFASIPVIKHAYPDAKIVIFIRDPRDWVTSVINWNTIYGKKDFWFFNRNRRITPKMLKIRNESAIWKNYSQFEKLCWYYSFVYTLLIKHSKIYDIPIYRYEDIFGRDNYTFQKFIKYITEFKCKSFSYHIPTKFLTKRIHNNEYFHFPEWRQWNTDQAKFLWKKNRHIMEQFDYGNEHQWKKIVSNEQNDTHFKQQLNR